MKSMNRILLISFFAIFLLITGGTANAQVPSNDLCANAIAVAVPSSTAGNTTTATVDSTAPNCGSAFGTTTGGGVWYTVVGNGQLLKASLCGGATFDTQIRVYTGSCGALVCVDGNDQFCGSGNNQSEVSWCSVASTTYLILVDGSFFATGAFTLNLSGQNVTLSSSLTPPAICSGTQFNYTPTSTTSGATFAWTRATVSGISQSGTSGSTNVSETLTNTTSGPINVTYVYTTTANSCSGTPQNVVVAVNATPPQPGVITGSASVCSGSTNTYSIAAVSGATSYTWTMPSGWTGTSTTTSINATANSTGGNVSVAANGCSSTSSAQILAVTIATAPASPGAITGNATICSGSTNTYSITAVSGASSYTWTTPSGWSGGSASTSISAIATTTSGNITVTANNCGLSSAATIKAITVNLSPTLNSSLTPPAICSGSFVYTATSAASAPTITWSRAAVTGISQVLAGGSGSVNETLTNTTTAALNVTYIYSIAANGCSSTGQNVVVSVKPTPALSSTLTPSAVCSGGFVYTPSSSTSGTSYSWTRAAVAGISQAASTGTGTVNEVLTNTTAAAVNVTYSYTSTASGCSNSPQNVVVTVFNTPAVPGPISGTAAVCTGSPYTYSIAAVSGATSYQWTLPNGFVAVGGGSNSSISTIANGSPSGNISVVANSSCGASPAQTFAITSNSLPVITTPPAHTSSCVGETKTLSVVATGTGLTYQWKEDKGSGFINVATGSTTASLTLTGIIVSMTGYIYQCVVTNACGSSVSTAATLSVTSPAKPTITLNATNPEAPVLTASSGDSYEWSKDGNPAGTSQTLIAAGPGVYTVKIKFNGCVSELSSPQALIITGDFEKQGNPSLNLYPNPGSDYVNLSLGGFERDQPVAISIVDMLGRVMEKTTGLGEQEVTIDVHHYAGGKYIAWMQQHSIKASRPFYKSDK